MTQKYNGPTTRTHLKNKKKGVSFRDFLAPIIIVSTVLVGLIFWKWSSRAHVELQPPLSSNSISQKAVAPIATGSQALAPEIILNKPLLASTPMDVERREILSGTIEIPCIIGNARSCIIKYTTSVNSQGLPVASANNLVYQFPFPEEREIEKSELYQRLSQDGFTVMSVWIPKMAASENPLGFFENKKSCYLYAESGSYDMYKKALDAVVLKLKLKDLKVVTLGISGGGVLAQRIAESGTVPSIAFATLGGTRFIYDINPKQNAIGLFIWNFGDGAQADNVAAVNAYCKAGRTVVCAPGVPEWSNRGIPKSLFSHVMTKRSIDIAVQFVRDSFKFIGSTGPKIKQAACDKNILGVPLNDVPADFSNTMAQINALPTFPQALLQTNGSKNLRICTHANNAGNIVFFRQGSFPAGQRLNADVWNLLFFADHGFSSTYAYNTESLEKALQESPTPNLVVFGNVPILKKEWKFSNVWLIDSNFVPGVASSVYGNSKRIFVTVDQEVGGADALFIKPQISVDRTEQEICNLIVSKISR